jgi:biotin synthase
MSNDDAVFIEQIATKVLNNMDINFSEAEQLLSTNDTITLAKCANSITRTFNGNSIDVETLINAKSGRCPEDCSFCAQSSFYESVAATDKYPLLPKQVIIERARKVKEEGASSFCLVCAYRSPPERDFEQICETIEEINKNVGMIDVNVSLGFLTHKRARRLKSIGVKRYNHNLEAAESYFSQICTTHEFADRVKTAKIVKEEGLQLCCGGIIGMGETAKQRLELAFSIKSLGADEVPINILIAKEGTPLANLGPLDPVDALKTIAVWRFIMPTTILKIAGGRELHLKDNDRTALKAGANGIITGGYLTTGGNNSREDLEMIKEIGFTPSTRQI